MKIFIAVAIISALFILIEFLSRKSIIEKEFGRKMLHLFSALVAVFSPYLVEQKIYLVVTGINLSIITVILLKKNLLPAIDSRERKSWGIFYFTLAYTLLVIVLPYEKLWVMQITFLVLGLSDSIAAIIGLSFGKKYFYLTRDKKSAAGSSAFFITTIVIFFSTRIEVVSLFLFGITFPRLNLHDLIAAGIFFSIILTAVEAISSGGSDNLFITIFAAPLVYLFFSPNYFGIDFSIILLSIPLAIGAAVLSHRFRFLTLDGSAAMLVLALLLFGLGGVKWTLPILFFFISSSLFSKLKKNIAVHGNSKSKTKSESRNYMQVISNGGIGAVLVLINFFTQSELWFYIFVIIVAVACADTWATEFGTRFGKNTISIISFKRIQAGISGGISFAGTVAAFAGSYSVALISSYFIYDARIIFVVVMFGFFGSIIDSILGATIQAKYECMNCNLVVEKKMHCDSNGKLLSGFHSVNNDSVNFLSGFISAIIFLFVFLNK